MLEIIDITQDIYTRVHCTNVICTLSKIASHLFVERQAQTEQLFNRVLSPSFD